jgi:hypothetical protein
MNVYAGIVLLRELADAASNRFTLQAPMTPCAPTIK